MEEKSFKKPIKRPALIEHGVIYYDCPNCGKLVAFSGISLEARKSHYPHCENCRQGIEWAE